MRNLSLNDVTQRQILPHLCETERLLTKVTSRLSGRPRQAEIVAMPDLGLPLNVTRICGGFFTGAFYNWETDVPFVPIDATVNVCGVSVFRLKSQIDNQTHFESAIASAVKMSRNGKLYEWNFESGNHFVTYAAKQDNPDEHYVILHSSAAEWKQQTHGLYPTPGNWYWDDVRVETGNNHRFLRYISGSTAEKFIERAQELTSLNRDRLNYFASAIFGDDLEEVIYQPHYGMPTRHSVAIGCQWMSHSYLWLTAPQKPLVIISPELDKQNQLRYDSQDIVLTPHGLGLQLKFGGDIVFDGNGLIVAGRKFRPGMSLAQSQLLEIRASTSTKTIMSALKCVLERCPGRVEGVLQPLYSYHQGTPRL